MSQSMVSPGAADLAFVDELVSISMHESAIVLRPTRAPDALGTRVFTDVVNAATAAGSVVVLHGPGAVADPTAAIGVPAATGVGFSEPLMAEPGGIGLLIVRSESAVWTIDYGSNRFVCSDRPVHRLALVGSDWTPFEAMWIAPHFVRALTVDGSYLTGRRTSPNPCQLDVRSVEPEPLQLSHTA